jgi:malate dehydrogenase (oxaloacetate-decarboxylating)(NADP+)
MNTKKGTFFLADTLFNRHPSAETIFDVAKLTYESVKFFNQEPVMALLSYSNFGSEKDGSAANMQKVTQMLHKTYPNMVVDGEMQVNFALNKELRDKKFPFSKLQGKEVNTLIFPNLNSANMIQKMMLEMGVAEVIGPIQMGLNKPVHILDVESSVRGIVNMTAVAVLDAMVEERIARGEIERVSEKD